MVSDRPIRPSSTRCRATASQTGCIRAVTGVQDRCRGGGTGGPRSRSPGFGTAAKLDALRATTDDRLLVQRVQRLIASRCGRAGHRAGRGSRSSCGRDGGDAADGFTDPASMVMPGWTKLGVTTLMLPVCELTGWRPPRRLRPLRPATRARSAQLTPRNTRAVSSACGVSTPTTRPISRLRPTAIDESLVCGAVDNHTHSWNRPFDASRLRPLLRPVRRTRRRVPFVMQAGRSGGHFGSTNCGHPLTPSTTLPAASSPQRRPSCSPTSACAVGERDDRRCRSAHPNVFDRHRNPPAPPLASRS